MRTEKALDEAVSSVTVVLNAAGYEVKVNKVNIATKELAIQYQFISSPIIYVNGNDIAVELREVYQAKQGESVCEPYQLPMNLKTFFTSKARKDEANIQMKEGNGL